LRLSSPDQNDNQRRTNKIARRRRHGEYYSTPERPDVLIIIISGTRLRRPDLSPCYLQMLRWRTMMRELSAEARLHNRARASSNRTAVRLHTAAVYGAFALIAAIVFGATSVRPF
jgi:hypothetical protein